MDVHVEEVGPCKRKITVQVPPEDVKGKFDENYENLRKNLDLPGFRRGHVPRRLMERRFGEDVAKDVRRALLDESYEKAVEENELDVVGAPDFKEDELQAASAEEAFSYTVTVEVKPIFELPDYTRLSLAKPSVEPTEKELGRRIDYYRHRMATFEVIEGAAEAEDVLTADVDFKVGDDVVWKRESIPLLVKGEDIVGVPIDNLSAELTGCKAGDVKTFQGTLPETFEVEEHRGKATSVVVTVKEAKRLVLPEANDEWASEMGFDSFDELKEELGAQIRRLKLAEARENMKQQIRDQLVDMVHMDMPQELVQRVSEENRRRRRLVLEQRMLEEEEIEKAMQEEEELSTEEARKNVKIYFIFDAIAKQETVLVTEDELHARVDELGASYRMDGKQLWDLLEADNRLDYLRREMVDEKVIDFLISKATVTEAAPAEAQPAPAQAAEVSKGSSQEGKQTE